MAAWMAWKSRRVTKLSLCFRKAFSPSAPRLRSIPLCKQPMLPFCLAPAKPLHQLPLALGMPGLRVLAELKQLLAVLALAASSRLEERTPLLHTLEELPGGARLLFCRFGLGRCRKRKATPAAASRRGSLLAMACGEGPGMPTPFQGRPSRKITEVPRLSRDMSVMEPPRIYVPNTSEWLCPVPGSLPHLCLCAVICL